MRVFLAPCWRPSLIAAGEWARRTEILGHRRVPSAHIPNILTAAGTAVAYADGCAYGLYWIHRPAGASCCWASWRWRRSRAALLHGPALAGPSASSAPT